VVAIVTDTLGDFTKSEKRIPVLPLSNAMFFPVAIKAITNFVNKFGDVFIENVPTSGFVSLQFDADSWNAINKGKTHKTIFPKDLK
jgi:hypothetical protein